MHAAASRCRWTPPNAAPIFSEKTVCRWIKQKAALEAEAALELPSESIFGGEGGTYAEREAKRKREDRSNQERHQRSHQKVRL